MSYVYSFHRFASEAAFNTALAELGWTNSPPFTVSWVVVSEVYDTETATPVAGHHLNCAWLDFGMPDQFKLSQVWPQSPRQMISGSQTGTSMLFVQHGVPFTTDQISPFLTG